MIVGLHLWLPLARFTQYSLIIQFLPNFPRLFKVRRRAPNQRSELLSFEGVLLPAWRVRFWSYVRFVADAQDLTIFGRSEPSVV
jgi:hypothetical protein